MCVCVCVCVGGGGGVATHFKTDNSGFFFYFRFKKTPKINAISQVSQGILSIIVGYSASQLWGKLKPASWNFEVGQAIIKKTKIESYNDV